MSDRKVRLTEEAFLREVRSLLARGEEREIPLRACGSVGIYLSLADHPEAVALFRRRDDSSTNGVFKDLDLAAFEKHSAPLYRLFVRELGFSEDRETNALFGMHRNIFFHPGFQIDVFFDSLRFSHEIPLKGRFPGGPALRAEEQMLSKLQVHDVTRRDLIDLAALLVAHPIEQMDRAYLGGLLGNDWGFWYDAQNNVRSALEEMERLAAQWPSAAPRMARERLQALGGFLEELPKTRRWEKRRQHGTAEIWFEPVEEVR
jgi:hypothetical protein